MTFLQVTLGENESTMSGVALRNHAVFETLLKLNFGQTIELAAQPVQHRAIFGRHPTVINLNVTSFQLLIARIAHLEPDFVIFEGVPLLEAAKAVRAAFPKLKLIADFHNVESHLFKHIQAMRLPKWLRFFAPVIFASKMRQAKAADKKMIATVNQVWVCSESDAALVEKIMQQIPVCVIPNSIPDWCSMQCPIPERKGTEILFVGHLGYKPNKNAAAQLCSEIMPALNQVFPNATLHVAGRNPGKKLSNLIKSAGYRLTGNPVALDDLYQRSAVTAIPLQSGGGTRIKVLEALAMGLPIIATRKAVEGLGLEAGRHYAAAETAQQFAAGLEILLTNKMKATQMAKIGQSFVFEKFGPAALLKNVSAAISSIELAVAPRQ